MYHLISFLFRVFLFPFKGKFYGFENVPKEGGAVLTANHSSYLDHYMIGVYFKSEINRDVWFLAKKEHFNNPLAKIYHKVLKAIPLDRETGGREAMKKATVLLQKGELVMIYPEGTRTLTGEMLKAKPGAAKLALNAKVPILPIGLINTFEIWPKGQNLPKPGKKADVNIGEPIYLDEYYGMENNKAALQKIINKVMKRIAALAGKEYPYDSDQPEQQ